MDISNTKFLQTNLSSKEIVYDLLVKIEYYEPNISGSNFANHLPLLLNCMYLLEFPQERIVKMFNKYFSTHNLEKTSPKKSQIKIEEDNFLQHLGNKNNYYCYAQFIKDADLKLGRNYLIRNTISLMIQGIGSQMFHPLTRISYALTIDFNNLLSFELTNAIAHLAVEYSPFEIDYKLIQQKQNINEHDNIVSPYKQFQNLASSVFINNMDFSYGSMNERIIKVLNEYEFQSLTRPLKDKGGSEMAYMLASLLFQVSDFTIQHVIIGMQSIRNVGMYFLDKSLINLAWDRFWEIACAAYISIGTPFFEYNIPSIYFKEIPEWQDIMKSVQNCDDEHTIQLVYALLKEETHFQGEKGHEIFQILAAKEVGLIVDVKNKKSRK